MIAAPVTFGYKDAALDREIEPETLRRGSDTGVEHDLLEGAHGRVSGIRLQAKSSKISGGLRRAS